MNASNRKPRIALVGAGVLGGGPLGQGVPVLADLFERLSTRYDIVYYSYLPIDTSQISPAIEVRQPIRWRLPGRIKYFSVTMRCAWDHLFRSFDIIFAVSIYPTGWYALLLRRLIRKPLVVQLIACEAVSLQDIGHGNLTIPWLAEITRRVCRQTDHLVTVAHIQKDIAKQCLPIQREIDVLPLRINATCFPYVAKSVDLPVQFIHIAYYSRVKDQDTMFRAFARIVMKIPCTLTVIGNGYETVAVEALLQQLNILDKVHFVGFVPQSDLPKYFRTAHILFHTARFETGCAVIQEAMASGVVVCGTSVGILADLGEGYAVAVAPGDDVALAAQTLQLVADKKRYSEFQQRGYQWITTYGAAWAADNYLQYLDSIVNKDSSR